MADVFDVDEIMEGEVEDTADCRRARHLHDVIVSASDAIRSHLFDISIALSIIHDDHLYTLLGYTNFSEYVSGALSFSLSRAKQFRVVGSYIRSVQSGQKRDLGILNKFDDLSVKKVYVLATMQNGEFERLTDQVGGFDNLKALSGNALNQQLKELRQSVKEDARNMGAAKTDSLPDQAVIDWVSQCLQLSSLIESMDHYFSQNSGDLSESALSHMFSLIRTAVRSDLDHFSGRSTG